MDRIRASLTFGTQRRVKPNEARDIEGDDALSLGRIAASFKE